MRAFCKTFAAGGAALLTALGVSGLIFQTALAEDTPDLERGQAVYDYWCLPCHAPGPGHPGTQSLQIRDGDSRPAVLEERDDLTPDLIKVFVRQGVLSMPPFRKTEITDAELEDLAAYLAQAQ